MTNIGGGVTVSGYAGESSARRTYYTVGQKEPLRAIIQAAPFPTRQLLETLITEYAEMAMATMRFAAGTAAPGYALWRLLEGISAVEALWVDRDPDGLDVWVIANGLSRGSERQVYRLYRDWLIANPSVLAELHLRDRAQLQTTQDWTFGDAAIKFSRRRHA